MKNLFSVEGKVAIVTGGSRGIGNMIAQGFVENGARTYITARKLPELQEAETVLGQLGECIAIQADLSSMEGIKAFVAEISAREEKIDILVNNAGATWGESFENFPEAGWDKVMDLNVKSPFFLTQQLLPQLRASASAADPARVINISSTNGITNPKLTNYSYSASKAAVIQMTRHLAADLAAEHINVNGIAPNVFPSKMTAYVLADYAEAIAESIPRGRVGCAEDMAGTAIYLCSQASSWVTGHTLVLDGGVIAAS